MEAYRSIDKTTTKYVHDNGAETAIKTVSGCNNILNPLTGQLEDLTTARNKYAVFASSFVGCPMRCSFCYLTVKKCPCYSMTDREMLENLQEALTEELKHNKELVDKYVKLSWMGMGEPLYSPTLVTLTTKRFLDWVFKNDLALGLDGVDLATIGPPGVKEWLKDFHIYDILDNYEFNPDHKEGRSRFRLFYSLHSAYEHTRKHLIPGASKVEETFRYLNAYCLNHGLNFIVHHMFIKDVNDSDKEIWALLRLMAYAPEAELRILRFNECDNSPYKESDKVLEITQKLSCELEKVKFQISVGSEIKSACGQFILKRFVDN